MHHERCTDFVLMRNNLKVFSVHYKQKRLKVMCNIFEIEKDTCNRKDIDVIDILVDYI